MKVPNCENAFVAPEKIETYLMNPDHPDGGSKARFFLQVGFDNDTLESALKQKILENIFAVSITNLFGTKYVVEAQIESPSGFSFNLRSVWVILSGSLHPILITAYPLKK